MNISIQKSAHAAVKVQSAAPVAGPSMVQANVSESPHTLVNVKLMDFQGNETKIIDEDEDKSNAEFQSISTSSLSTIAVEHNYSKKPVETSHVWVRFGKYFLTTLERHQINYNKQLTDKHINYAQNIIKKTNFTLRDILQFPSNNMNPLLQNCLPPKRQLKIRKISLERFEQPGTQQN